MHHRGPAGIQDHQAPLPRGYFEASLDLQRPKTYFPSNLNLTQGKNRTMCKEKLELFRLMEKCSVGLISTTQFHLLLKSSFDNYLRDENSDFKNFKA